MSTSLCRIILAFVVVTGGSCFAAANVDYSTQIQPIFNNSGCIGCHGNAGGLNLTAPNSYKNLVNVAAATSSGVRVKPNDPTNSVLLRLYSSMPNSSKTVAADKQLITDWINQGALETGGGGGSTTPTITSVATASPNPAQVAVSVSFSVAATDPNGSPLTYTWNFGDASTGTGTTATHSYAAIGTYSAVVTVSNGSTSATSTISVAVTVDGTTPGTMTISRLNGKGTYGKTGKDSASLEGKIPSIPLGFDPTNKVVTLNVGGATAQFTLNAKGKAKTANGSFSLKIKHEKGASKLSRSLDSKPDGDKEEGGIDHDNDGIGVDSSTGGETNTSVSNDSVEFNVSLVGTYTTAWGFDFSKSVKNQATTMIVSMVLDGTTYTQTLSGKLNVTANKTLTFKF